MRPLLPIPYAARPGKGTGKIEPKARKKVPTSTRRLHPQPSSARPETATMGQNLVAAEDNRARRKQTTPVFAQRSKTAPRNSQQARRVPLVDPESPPPANGSRRPE